MGKKPHPADLATLDAILHAEYFTACIRVRNSMESHPFKTLAKARAAAALMPAARGVLTKALVYAVTAQGYSYLVPDDMADPTAKEIDMGSLTAMAAKLEKPQSEIMKQAAKAIGAAADKAAKATPAPEAGKAGMELDLTDPRNPLHRPMTPEVRAKIDKNIDAAKRNAERRDDVIPEAVKSGQPGKWRDVRAESEAASAKRKKEKRSAAAKKAAATRAANKPEGAQPKAEPELAKPQTEKDDSNMPRKTSKTTKSTARTKVAPKAKTSGAKKPAGERNRYDWSGAMEKAEKGVLPAAPDFSAPTHERFRPLLAEVVKAAKDGNLTDLKKIKISPVSSSPKAVAKYRDICVKALTVKLRPKAA